MVLGHALRHDRVLLAWLVLALLLVAGAALREGWREPAAPAMSLTQRQTYESCAEGAEMRHDVRWAVACADGQADCDLPPELAQRLYEVLNQEHHACLAAVAGQAE